MIFKRLIIITITPHITTLMNIILRDLYFTNNTTSPRSQIGVIPLFIAQMYLATTIREKHLQQ